MKAKPTLSISKEILQNTKEFCEKRLVTLKKVENFGRKHLRMKEKKLVNQSVDNKV